MPDELLRPALELAVLVAKSGESALPPEPGPRGLRPFLQFSRLPAAALQKVRRVVDDDDDFRRRVADAVPDDDAVGRAGWLFLHRPDGWVEELSELAVEAAAAVSARDEARAEASAVRRLAVVEGALSSAESDLRDARGEAAALREELARERRARRNLDADLGRARQRAGAMEAELAAAADRLAAADALAEEVRRLRAQVEELRQDIHREPVGPEGRDPAVVDTGIDTAIDAAALVRALAAAGTAVTDLAAALADATDALPPGPPSGTAPPPPGELPVTSPRRRPAGLPPGVFDDTIEAAAHLVRLDGVLVLVDGYNVTKQARPDLALAEQRQWLFDGASGLAARTGADVHLVFDGAEAGTIPADRPRRAGVQVRYTPAGTEADDVLLTLVAATPVDRPVVVVSSDRQVQTGARRLGANVVSSSQLVDLLRR